LKTPHPTLTTPLLRLVTSSAHLIQSQDLLVQVGLAVFALRVADGNEHHYVGDSFLHQCKQAGVTNLPQEEAGEVRYHYHLLITLLAP
jgi:hypothetical protein